MLYWERSLRRWCGLLLFSMFLGWTTSVRAEDGVSLQRLEAEWVSELGRLHINSRFKINLPDFLYDALHQGVPLSFQLSFSLRRPRIYAYTQRLRLWFKPNASRVYQLSYHPLTRHYRVRYGELSSDYVSLQEALAQIGLARSWTVLKSSYLSGQPADEIVGRVQLRLELSDLPDLFQMDPLGSKAWKLSSPWYSVCAIPHKDD